MSKNDLITPPIEGKIVFSTNWDIQNFKKLDFSGDAKIDLSSSNKIDFDYDGEVTLIDKSKNNTALDPENGQKLFNKYPICGYDESILTYQALEGVAKATSHAHLTNYEDNWIPSVLISASIYSRSKEFADKNQEVQLCTDTDINNTITNDYLNERHYFLEQLTPQNSITFIDGPLFTGAMVDANFKLIDAINVDKSSLVFFMKKGCNSQILCQNYDWAYGYNSDIHWANTSLKEESYTENIGYRTPFFSYVSKMKDGKSFEREKIFCYAKFYENRSPVRIEFTRKQYDKLDKNELEGIFDIIAYLYYADGNLKSPQLRHIAVAEKYARETLISTNIYKTVSKYGLTPTQNEERFP